MYQADGKDKHQWFSWLIIIIFITTISFFVLLHLSDTEDIRWDLGNLILRK